MGGMELSGRGNSAEFGSVGRLAWDGTGGSFDYLPADWLTSFTRANWRSR